MPAVLTDTNLCESKVPSGWKPVLEKLRQFLQAQQQIDSSVGREGLVEIQQLHDELLEASRELCEPHALDDVSDEEIQRCFARAVFALMYTGRAVMGEDAILDTTDCRTLKLYEPDFCADPNRESQMLAALQQAVDLDIEAVKKISDQVKHEFRDAERKHKIIHEIRDLFDLWEDSPSSENESSQGISDRLRQNIFRFFEAFYPEAGLVAEEVELVITGSMIFFCLPFREYELTTQRFRDLPKTKQATVSDFLKRLSRFQQWQFAHFPVFGFRRGSDLPDDFLLELSAKTGLSIEALTRELSTICAIIPLTEIDKYVVHDIWGHSWQACLLSFDHHYRTLATYASKLSLTETARLETETTSFESCFEINEGSVTYDANKFRAFTNMEISERLPSAMVPVFAEILADVAEFKLVATQKLDSLEGSSHFDHLPAKLDLTLKDVEFYFRQATKVFRLWTDRKGRREKTIQELVQRGADEESAKSAVALAVQDWCDLEDDWLAPTPRYCESDNASEITVNVFSRLCLNFLSVHATILDTYHQVGELETEMLPIKGFRDLLIISAAVFLEAAPTRNLWRIDEFLSERIVPLCVRLAKNSK